MLGALSSRCVNRPIELTEQALLGGCAAGTSCQQRRIPEYRQVAPFETQLTGLDVAVYQFRLHGTAVTSAEGAAVIREDHHGDRRVNRTEREIGRASCRERVER